MKKTMVNALRNLRPILFILFLALVGAQSSGAGGHTVAQTAPARPAQVDINAEAKRALDKIGSRDFKRVKDARLRAAGAHALDALKKLARNTSKAREAALLAEFNRSVDALKAAAPGPKTASLDACDHSYETCKELCKNGGACQCEALNNLCYMTNLMIELVEGEDPSKH